MTQASQWESFKRVARDAGFLSFLGSLGCRVMEPRSRLWPALPHGAYWTCGRFERWRGWVLTHCFDPCIQLCLKPMHLLISPFHEFNILLLPVNPILSLLIQRVLIILYLCPSFLFSSFLSPPFYSVSPPSSHAFLSLTQVPYFSQYLARTSALFLSSCPFVTSMVSSYN